VIVITLLGLIAGMAVPSVWQLGRAFSASLFRKDLSESADAALNRMSREIRRLRDATSIIIANASTYRFVDIDGNTRQYSVNGTNLERFDGTNTDILLQNASSFAFTYLDGSLAAIGTPLVSPNATNIRFVQIDMTVSSGSNTLYYRERVRLHRLRSVADLFS
jgi:hypothetical protein